MTYEPQEWVDKETVITAERLSHMEAGISAANAAANAPMPSAEFSKPGAVTMARVADTGRPSRVSVSWATYRGAPYCVVRVFDALRPGVIGKTLGGQAESSGKTGPQLVPVAETLRHYAARTGSPIVANADGWRTTGNVGEPRGPQIIGGKVLHDFGDPADRESGFAQGIEALGVRADGTYRGYSARDGDTAASMVADGVVTSLSYGPRVVRDGALRDITTDPFWDQFVRTISARQIIGYTADGTFLIITITGVSGESGIAGNDIGTLARQEGAHDAWVMDGGGSAQTLAAGAYAMPSSDAGCERPVPSALLVNAVVAGAVRSPWWPATIQDSKIVQNSAPPMWRLSADRIEFTGDVVMTDGSKMPGSVPYALRIPFKPARQTAAAAISTGIYQGKVLLRTDGQINLYGDATNTTFLELGALAAPYLT